MGIVEKKKCANKDHTGDPLLEATLDNFSVDNKSKDGMSSWCKVCQRNRYTPQKKAIEMNINDYMSDGQGRLVHVDNVKEIDKTRDGLVRNLVENARKVQKAMSEFKDMAMSEIDAFVDLSAQEYDVKIGGKKGNLTLYSYDMRYKAQVQISEYLVFDERLQVAKKMIDDCLNKWTENSRAEVRTIINDAFAVDQEGRINTRRILSLRRLDIQDALWQKAMTAITDSLQVAGSKSYFRIYNRTGPEGQWQNITLDMAAL